MSHLKPVFIVAKNNNASAQLRISQTDMYCTDINKYKILFCQKVVNFQKVNLTDPGLGKDNKHTTHTLSR